MKHLHTLLVAIALLGFGSAFSQKLEITPGDTFTYSGTLVNANDSHEQTGYFINNTADTTRIYWKCISATMDSLWQMSFCDPQNCYYYNVGQGLGNYGLNHFNVLPHGSYLLRFGVSPTCSADSGKLLIQTWLGSDSAGSVQFLHYSASYTGSCVSAVQSVTAPQFVVYPNPVNSVLTIDGLNGFKNVKLTVYDILGNVAVEKYVEQPAGATSFNTGSLQAGVYFVTIDSEGSRLLTKRIQKLD